MPPEIRDRIFEPFFTSKTDDDSRKGLGLGLSIVKGLVESAGGTNEVQLREGGQPVEYVVSADGKIEKSFQIPKAVGEPRFVGPTGIDPNNPLEYGLELRVIYEVGSPYPSENFGDIVGKIESAPAPGWLSSLGLVAQGQNIPTLVPGKMAETIALGLLATLFSTIFAIPVSFLAAHNIMLRVPGGSVIYYVVRTLLNIVRAIDTVIWGLIIVVWIGLGPFAGMMALMIHSVAALGKLYSEEIEHIDVGPIEAVTASGAQFGPPGYELDLLYIACAAAFAGAIISVLQVLDLLQSPGASRPRAAAARRAP